MDHLTTFRVAPGKPFRLMDIDPDFKESDKEAALTELAKNNKRLNELQELMYAEHKRALLVCLQGTDTGGKDGTISHVFSAMNQQGCYVHSFKEPTRPELDHDYLWRAHQHAPGKGEVAVFNRSHYEDVLIVRVHKLVPESAWKKRYEQINAMEKMLSENGTQIVKFFLHISKEEQLKRLRERLDDPSRHWKVSESDFTERAYWDDYQKAFDDMLTQCSTPQAPWYVIPANHKWFRNLAISRILVATMEAMQMQLPKVSLDIKALRKKLV